jgi:hypothetical protein
MTAADQAKMQAEVERLRTENRELRQRLQKVGNALRGLQGAHGDEAKAAWIGHLRKIVDGTP